MHEKELLAIVRALKKFRADLVGVPFTVRTDHATLKNFMDQRDLSRRQARWQEFFAQYDFVIEYLPGEQNTVANALSRLPSRDVPVASATVAAATKLSITVDQALVKEIHDGYRTNAF